MSGNRIAAAGAVACLLGLAGSAGSQPVAVPAASPPVAANQAYLAQTIGALDGPGFALAYGAAQGSLAVGTELGTIQFWDADVLMGVRLGNRSPSVARGHDGPVVALAWGGGRVLASAGADQQIRLWSMPAGKLLHSVTTAGICRALAMSPDGKELAAGTEASGIQIYDVATGRAENPLGNHGDWVTALAFSPDGKQLASGSLDGTACLWDVAPRRLLYCVPATGGPPAKGLPLPPNAVRSLAFSPDGKQLAAGGTDAAIHLLNAADGKMVRSLAGHVGPLTSLAFHPAGAVLASASKDRTVRLWNVSAGQPLKVLEGHTGWVQSLQFLARGTRLASTGADRTVRVWDLEDKKK